MWDRGLHSYAMVQATLDQGCDYLGRIPANVKFLGEEPLADGSYLSWIYPSGKLRRKGCQPITHAASLVFLILYFFTSSIAPDLRARSSASDRVIPNWSATLSISCEAQSVIKNCLGFLVSPCTPGKAFSALVIVNITTYPYPIRLTQSAFLDHIMTSGYHDNMTKY